MVIRPNKGYSIIKICYMKCIMTAIGCQNTISFKIAKYLVVWPNICIALFPERTLKLIFLSLTLL
jgi:hypothetical protein